jgi:DNA-nicking Smr family endonuclease
MSGSDSHSPSRRKRLLSDEDRALWQEIAKTIKPLAKKKRVTKIAASEIDAPSAPSLKAVRKTTVVAKPALPSPPAKPSSPPPLALLGRRERSYLAKGRRDIHGRLDLHGMTQERAHRALLNFLQHAQADGASFVLVITGKGRISAEGLERGVLRRQVPHWLGQAEFRSLVVGFDVAAIGHGGEGALYVRIRRAR